MPRAQSPNRKLAYQLWADSGGKRKLTDIAAQIGVSPEQVRKWKSTDAWEKVTLPKAKSNVTNPAPKRKGGAPRGNRNAAGKNRGALPGNSNALKHGGYSPVYWDTLTDEEKALLDTEKQDPETLLREEIELLSIRERRIMARIREYAETKGGLLLESVVRNEEKREFDKPLLLKPRIQSKPSRA